MKSLLKIIFLFISLNICGQVNPNDHEVKGYYRKDGTYVESYHRTNPNGTNRDNFSTKGNVNPYTGKEGWITPDNNTLYNNNTYSSYSSWTNRGDYKVGFWTDFGRGGQIKIYIDNIYAGTLDKYFINETPSCETTGALSLNFDAKTYNMKAVDAYGYYWNYNITLSGDKCNTFHLQYSNANKYKIGKADARYSYKAKRYAFWVPFLTTAAFFPVGIASTAGVNIFKPKIKVDGDEYYAKGYRRKANHKFFNKSFAGFSLGLVTNVFILYQLGRL